MEGWATRQGLVRSPEGHHKLSLAGTTLVTYKTSMETVRTLVSAQLLVTAFLAVLLWALHARLHRAEYNRWWVAAWTTFALFLAVGRLAIPFPPGWNLAQGGVVLLATLLGFAVAPLLVFGAVSFRSPSAMTRRAAWFGIGVALVLGAGTFAVSLRWSGQPFLGFAFRQSARTIVLAVSLFFCARVFFQRVRMSKSPAALVTSLSFLGFGLTQTVYAGALLTRLLRGSPSEPGSIASVAMQAGVKLLYLDTLLICGLCLGMILLLVEAHLQAERALVESHTRAKEATEENTVLQEEIRTRFEVERALRSSEEKFAIVFRSSPAAKVIISLETGKFLDVNAAFEAQSGYSREELLQQPVLDAGIWSNADLDVLRDALRQERPLAAREMRLRHRSGRESTIVFSAEVVPVGGQKCLLLAGLDTTARKHAEERQRAMLKALPDWVFLTDAAGTYLEFYGTERDLLMPPTEFIGRNMAEVLPPELVEKSFANIRAALASDEPTHMEYSLQIGDGLRYYEVRSVRTERDHVLSLVRDVTDQKRAEYRTRELGDELAHAGRVMTLGALNGSLAHEINQPLAAISTNAYVALRLIAAPAPDFGTIRELLGDVLSDSQRIDDVLRRLRMLLRKDRREYAPVDVNTIVNEVLKLLHNNLIERQITIEMSLAANVPAVRGDRIQLQQVVLNLVLNAADAVSVNDPGERSVRVTTSSVDGKVMVSVTDRGPAVSDTAIERFFEPFHTTKEEGMGLGLSICRTILEAHGGEIDVKRNADRGLALWFSLDAVKPWQNTMLFGATAGAADADQEGSDPF